jgi:hypothetical protein
MSLTHEQIVDFQTHGYVIAEDVFSPADYIACGRQACTTS